VSRRIIDLLFFLSWFLVITHALFFVDFLAFTADLTSCFFSCFLFFACKWVFLLCCCCFGRAKGIVKQLQAFVPKWPPLELHPKSNDIPTIPKHWYSLLLSWQWKHNRGQIRKNRAVIARIQHTRRKRRACFLFFCQSDRLSTTVARQRNLGQTEGKFILVHGWRPMDGQRLGRKLTNIQGNLPKTLRRSGSFYWETRY